MLFAEGLHDEPWLEAHTIGWRDLRDRVASFPPERVAEITGISAATIVALARRFGTTKPALVKIADGLQRHGNGGQTVRAIISLPAVVGQVGVRGGGLSYLYGARGPLPSGMGVNGPLPLANICAILRLYGLRVIAALRTGIPCSRRGHRRQALTQWVATYVA